MEGQDSKGELACEECYDLEDALQETVKKYMKEALQLKELGVDLPHLPR